MVRQWLHHPDSLIKKVGETKNATVHWVVHDSRPALERAGRHFSRHAQEAFREARHRFPLVDNATKQAQVHFAAAERTSRAALAAGAAAAAKTGIPAEVSRLAVHAVAEAKTALGMMPRVGTSVSLGARLWGTVPWAMCLVSVSSLLYTLSVLGRVVTATAGSQEDSTQVVQQQFPDVKAFKSMLRTDEDSAAVRSLVPEAVAAPSAGLSWADYSLYVLWSTLRVLLLCWLVYCLRYALKAWQRRRLLLELQGNAPDAAAQAAQSLLADSRVWLQNAAAEVRDSCAAAAHEFGLWLRNAGAEVRSSFVATGHVISETVQAWSVAAWRFCAEKVQMPRTPRSASAAGNSAAAPSSAGKPDRKGGFHVDAQLLRSTRSSLKAPGQRNAKEKWPRLPSPFSDSEVEDESDCDKEEHMAYRQTVDIDDFGGYVSERRRSASEQAFVGAAPLPGRAVSAQVQDIERRSPSNRASGVADSSPTTCFPDCRVG
eukprot:TRINITY_DN40799_c0_g1_i3.p1 TRINITY_DN40799_c0_g1~~TRINITY_DN40799_c0_g1_i3.p1  ORF type:complete len:486 (+),score=97.58 TRINITY_DN40799_c0_g1_i3:160-1617(+)